MEEDEVYKMMRHSVDALRREVTRLNKLIENKDKTISNLKKKSK
jgi:prefoldin subunit 5